MELSIIIVSWRVRDLLRKCLEAVFRGAAGLSCEVLVVDNASGDGSVEMVARDFPQVRLIASNRNLGFAKANNQAIRQSSGKLVLLLNPDTEIRDDSLHRMIDWMARHPRAAILGPKLLNPDGSLQPSVRRFPAPLPLLMIMLKLHRLFPAVGPIRGYLAADFDYTREQRCDQVMGAALLVRREALERVGLLDERFFIWFEEVDLCKTVAAAGLETWYSPMTEVVHHGGESFGQVFGPKRQRMFNDSLLKYVRKHHGLFVWLALLAFHPLSMLLARLSAMRPIRAKSDKL